MLDKSQAEAIQDKIDAAADTGTVASQLNIVVSLMLGVSLKQIWSVLNTLQLIVYTSEIEANLPAVSLTMLKELRRVALFEFIPYQAFTDQIKAAIPASED